MLIFDQLKKNDPHLRWLAVIVAGGLLLLLAGLWWMQIVCARDYMANLETQSIRTVRIPAVRGKIFDRNGNTLAENRPGYNINLYLEELTRQFDAAVTAETARAKALLAQQARAEETRLGRALSSQEKKPFLLSVSQKTWIRQQSRYTVASNLVQYISRQLQAPLAFDFTNFERHCKARLALPYPVARNIDSARVARFEEQFANAIGTDLEIQAVRVYPWTNTAAHVLGYLRYKDQSLENEDASYYFPLPYYSGELGIEAGFDRELHGLAGTKSVLINSLGYRRAENIQTPANPGTNVVLTLDLQIQRETERALQTAVVGYPGPPRGAAVVMDVQTGDILAMASSPSFDPNLFARPQGISRDEYQRIQAMTAEKNRATQENYQCGSIFKTIVAMAALDSGLDPKALYEVKPYPGEPEHGVVYVGRPFRDLAGPGSYDFHKALIKSSNAYFIWAGLRAGIERIVKIGERLHLGESFRGDGPRSHLPTRQETPGNFPNWSMIHSGWSDGDTANVCIGQGKVDVTPLQMAVLASAIANGGKVLWPRFVDRVEPQEPTPDNPPEVMPRGEVRDNLGVKPRTLQILKEAMLDDTEDANGTANYAFRDWPYQSTMRVCGKTGTAQVKDIKGNLIRHDVWFLSFAPYDKPRYAVVVMIEGGSSGGGTCAPVGRMIYEAIVQSERANATRTGVVAQNH